MNFTDFHGFPHESGMQPRFSYSVVQFLNFFNKKKIKSMVFKNHTPKSKETKVWIEKSKRIRLRKYRYEL